MKLYIHIFIFNFFFLIPIVACKRQPTNNTNKGSVMLNIDWSESGISPHGATAIFYPRDGEKPVIFIMGTPEGEKIKLQKGVYDVVVFNQTIDEFRSLEFRGVERYDTFEVFTMQESQNSSGKLTKGDVIACPDDFAVAKKEGFEVTEQMIEACDFEEEISIDFTPISVVSVMKIAIYVKNILSIKEAKGILTGMADSYRIAEGRNNVSHGAHSFTLKEMTVDHIETSNGTISGTFTTLGLPGTGQVKAEIFPKNILTVSFFLVDNKTVVDVSYEIGQRIEVSDNNLALSVGTGTPPGNEEHESDFPIELPKVDPKEDVGGGLDADVGDWGEEEIEIPI